MILTEEWKVKCRKWLWEHRSDIGLSRYADRELVAAHIVVECVQPAAPRVVVEKEKEREEGNV